MDTAVIFAGGKSSRMGKDKAFLPFLNTTLIEYQYRKMKAIFQKVYISTKTDKFTFEADFIYDNAKEFSPAVALKSVLEQLPDENIFAISVDVPFIKQNAIYTLYSALANHEVAVAKTKSGTQPLCAIYTKKVLPQLEAMLAQDIHKLNFLLQKCDCVYVEFDDEQSFLNLNHPHEYELALAKTERFK
jgi:molybdopterin-guanine dinucleotide biosynthesis protein A